MAATNDVRATCATLRFDLDGDSPVFLETALTLIASAGGSDADARAFLKDWGRLGAHGALRAWFACRGTGVRKVFFGVRRDAAEVYAKRAVAAVDEALAVRIPARRVERCKVEGCEAAMRSTKTGALLGGRGKCFLHWKAEIDAERAARRAKGA